MYRRDAFDSGVPEETIALRFAELKLMVRWRSLVAAHICNYIQNSSMNVVDSMIKASLKVPTVLSNGEGRKQKYLEMVSPEEGNVGRDIRTFRGMRSS